MPDNIHVYHFKYNFLDGTPPTNSPLVESATTLYNLYQQELIELTHQLALKQDDQIVVYAKMVYKCGTKDKTRPDDKLFADMLCHCINMLYAQTQEHLLTKYQYQAHFMFARPTTDLIEFGRKLRKSKSDQTQDDFL